MAGSATNIVVQPVNLAWQIEAREQISLAGISDPDGTEFNLFKVDGTKVRVVFDLDGGSTIPTPGAGEIVIEVEVVSGDSEATIATTMAAALDLDADLISSASSNLVDVRRAAVGQVTDAADVDSGVAITTCIRGKDFDLGLLAPEDVAPSIEPANFEVTSHQNGLTVLSLLNQGMATNEVELVLQETTKSKLQELYQIWGGAFTPGGGTAVFGMGTGVIGKNMLTEAARLVMTPVNDLGSELSYTYNIMLAIPVPSSLVFSGENPRTLTTSWRGFPDLDTDSQTDSVLIGDAFQTGLFT
jgi:hypothetical protein